MKPAPQKRRKGGFGVCQLSEPLSELLDRDVLPRNKAGCPGRKLLVQDWHGADHRLCEHAETPGIPAAHARHWISKLV